MEESKIKAEIDFDAELATLRAESEALELQSKSLKQQAQAKRAHIATLANQHNQANDFLNKPDEIWFKIFSYLPSQSRAALQRTCIRFFKLARDPRLPLFPVNYTAPPKVVEVKNIPVSDNLKYLKLFNLPLTKQLIVIEQYLIYDGSAECDDGGKETSMLVLRLLDNTTGQSETASTLVIPYFYIVRLITPIEKNKFMLIVTREGFTEFLSYNILSNHYEIIYQLATTNLLRCLQTTTNGFALICLSKNKRHYLRFLTLKSDTHEQHTHIDINVLHEDSDFRLEKIEHGKFKNHVIIYNDRKIFIVDLEGNIKFQMGIIAPEKFGNFQYIIQMINDNECIMAWKHGIWLVNFMTKKNKFITVCPDTPALRSQQINGNKLRIDRTLDSDRLLLIHKDDDSDDITADNSDDITAAVVFNWRTKSIENIFYFKDNLRVGNIIILKNGNWAITTKANNFFNKVMLFCFPEQQYTTQPLPHQDQALNSDESKITLGKRGRG